MSLKSVFVSTWLMLLMVALLHTIIALVASPDNHSWWLVVLSLLPTVLFFTWLMAARVPRTAPVIWFPIVAAGVATLLLLAMGADSLWIGFYVVVVGLIGNLLYQFWYSRLDRQQSVALQPGKPLPSLTFETADGKSVSTDDYPGALVLMFYRGNWCPLCMAQVREVAQHYQTLSERGVSVLLISPQPHDQTQALAERFNVPFEFLVDAEHRMAKKLEIFSAGGTPMGMEMFGYEQDTVFPTVIMTDADRQIIYADQTDNYRVRPEPEDFIHLLDTATAQ